MFPAIRSTRLLALLALAVCSTFVSAAASAANATAGSNVVAEFAGETITLEQLDKGIAGDLATLQDQIYQLRRQKLETMINDRLLSDEATRQKLSINDLLDREVTSKISLVTEREIDAFHEANKERITDGPQVRSQIRQYLQRQRLSAQREKYLLALRAATNVAINLPAPPALRVEVSSTGPLPIKGGEKASVTIVKFEDFQCPYCRQAQATLAQVESRYGNKIKVVHRDFPIDQIHPLARRAAEGARCASEQGKFWIYHDKLYATALTSDQNQLLALAKEVGLDEGLFERCLASGQTKDFVQRDVEEGKKLGISATPAFFINGRLLLGAQPVENFARIIDEELGATTTARAQ